MKIGVALGSGGARGLAHIGVLKAIVDSGVEISYISGSSMGAVVGAVYAATQSVDELDQVARGFTWRSLVRMFTPSISRGGLIDGENIVEFLRDHLPVRDFSQLNIPFALETTDLETGELVTIKEGDLMQAIRASISIPLIFTPSEIDGRILVDGGLVSPVPVKTVREMGADYVIAVNVLEKHRGWVKQRKTQSRTAGKEETSANFLSRVLRMKPEEEKSVRQADKDLGFMVVLTQTVGIAISRMADYQLQLENPELLIQPDTSDLNVYDFHRGAAVIDTAYRLTCDRLKELKFPEQHPLNI